MIKKVAVIILNFKVKEEIKKCIRSVQSSTYTNIEIIVVDNYSKDNLEKEISSFNNVYFYQNNKNIGYTGGNNIGIKLALNLGVDYILVLNPDTTIDKTCIENLVGGMEKNHAGIVGPKIYFSGTRTIWYAGGVMDLANVIGCHRGVDEKDLGQYDRPEETDYVTGAAILVKPEVIKKVGLFDENFFLYYEDSDFCIRAKKAGFKIFYIPSAIVYHDNAKSSGLGSPLQDYFITRNRMLYSAKHLKLRTRFALFREAVRNMGNPVRRLAFFDFLIGNFGKGSFKI